MEKLILHLQVILLFFRFYEYLWYLDLEPFWQGLGWEGENDLDDPIVRVAVWLSTQINHDACSKITTLVKLIGPAQYGNVDITVIFDR